MLFHTEIKPFFIAALCTVSIAGATLAQTTTPTFPAPADPGGNPGATPPPLPPTTPTPPPLPAPPPMAVFVAQNGAQTGPFDRAALEELIKSGALKSETLVWQEGMDSWQPAAGLPELAAMLEANPPATDPVAFLTGSWSASSDAVPVPGLGNGTVTMTSTYNADGSMTAFGTITVQTANGPLRIGINSQGTYTAQMLNATTIQITPNATITLTAPGQAPISNPDTTPVRLTILSPTSLRDEDGILYTKQ